MRRRRPRGSGTTTELVLLATRPATQYGARVLVLTFYHLLRVDIRHVLEGMPEAQALLGETIHVETVASFLRTPQGSAHVCSPHP